MTITQSLDTVRELSPVFDHTGIRGHRIITDDELNNFANACLAIRDELLNNEGFFSVNDIIEHIGADMVTDMVVSGFARTGEAAAKMLQFRKP